MRERKENFKYINNAVKMNELSALAQNGEAVHQFCNTACGGNEILNNLFIGLRDSIGYYDAEILKVQVKYGSQHKGDVKYSIGAIENFWGFQFSLAFSRGILESADWYLAVGQKHPEDNKLTA